jgi:hypothetical protein
LGAFLEFVKIHGDNFGNLRQKKYMCLDVTNFQSNCTEMVNGWATLKIFETLMECIVKIETLEVKLKMGSNFGRGKV